MSLRKQLSEKYDIEVAGTPRQATSQAVASMSRHYSLECEIDDKRSSQNSSSTTLDE
jgi:hypothetical protein